MVWQHQIYQQLVMGSFIKYRKYVCQRTNSHIKDSMVSDNGQAWELSEKKYFLSISIYSSDTSLPQEMSLKGVATAAKSPPLPTQTLPLCLIQPSLSGSTSLTHVLFYSVPQSHRWSSFTVWTLTFTHIHFLHRLLTPHPLNMSKPSQSISFHPFHHPREMYFLGKKIDFLQKLKCQRKII